MDTDDLPYFYGKISRSEAEQLLAGGGDGKFLTRVSTSSHGDYVLSVVSGGTCLHFQIKSQGECWFSIDDGPMFEGMESLVRYYMAHPDGLPTNLTKALARPPKKRNEAEGNTNLQNAALKGMVPAMKGFLKSGEIGRVNKMRRTALHEAVRGSQGGSVGELLAFLKGSSVDLNAGDELGCTPLHLSALTGHAAITRQLIVGGADPGLRNNNGETPRDIAARCGKVECCKLLGQAEAGLVTEADIAEMDLPWFHGKISRVVAEHILAMHGMKDGLFLVRESTSVAGDYVLSMTFGSAQYHFQIQAYSSKKQYFIDDGPIFEGLSKIVEYYRSTADGLPCQLRCFCRRSSPSSAAFLPAQFDYGVVTVRPVAPGGAKSKPSPSVSGTRPRTSASTSSARGGSASDAEADFDYHHMAKVEGRTDAPLMIQTEDLKLGKELGSGEFGAVYRGTWTRRGQPPVEVAVKTLRQEALGRSDEFLREANLMSRLKHPHVVNLLGVCLSQPLMIVQELVPLGALVDYLPKHRGTLTNEDLRLFAVQIAIGMNFLEEQRFVHRDLATRNILVHTPSHVKISDFGLSRSIGNEDNYYKASAGGKWPIKWYAPESVYFGKFTSKSDVWSFGVTLWEIWTFGELPYDDLAGREVLELIDKGERLTQPPNCPRAVYEVMWSCWIYEPENRPSFSALHDRLKAIRT